MGTDGAMIVFCWRLCISGPDRTHGLRDCNALEFMQIANRADSLPLWIVAEPVRMQWTVVHYARRHFLGASAGAVKAVYADCL